jgi:hypothetical protein
MRRVLISGATALSLLFAVPAFAIEGGQPPATAAPDFEQVRADHLKRIEERLNSLQKEKTCVQSAKNHDELRTCRAKHKEEMKGHHGEMRKGSPDGKGRQMAPPVK